MGTTIFTVMSTMADKYQALNLSQGFPDFDCPRRLRELVTFYLNDNRNQYAPMSGVPELRRQIADKAAWLYGHSPDVESEITVTAGATEALFDAILAFSGPGDEVILFDPAYDSYDPAVELAGARPVRIPLSAPGYHIDWDRVRDAISDRTRLIVINSPHNPCGSILKVQDLDTLAGLIREREDLFVLSDEVYEHMVFDGQEHQSVLRHPELRQRSLAVSSFGKTYHATGWKLAYCIAPAALSAEFRKVHQFVTFTSPAFMQLAVADFMAECPQHHLELPAFYQAKRDTFCELLKDSRFEFTPCEGSYFQLADYSRISDMNDQDFANHLVREKGIATIPLSPFYEKPPAGRHLRFCFAKEDATLERAAEILRAL